MNENIDLTNILKDCPEGWKFWSPMCGTVLFRKINEDDCIAYPLKLEGYNGYIVSLTKEGYCYKDCPEAECLLFPSKDQRDWGKFTAPWYKNEPEHKFHEGDWVVYNKDICQIVKREEGFNKLVTVFGIEKEFVNERNLSTARLWTIQDAKDGDVLALNWLEDKNLWEKIIIFKKYHSKGVKGLCSMPCVEGYGNTFKNGEMVLTEIPPYYSKTWTCNLHPATKEQRNLLFQKIKEAGYKWNNETKTLEKLVEHKFDPNTLQPFDKVLACFTEQSTWCCGLFSYFAEDANLIVCCGDAYYKYCIPYNDDTKHLVGTTDEAPEYYRYWEE